MTLTMEVEGGVEVGERVLMWHDYDVAEANGISRTTLDNRVDNLEWDIERAITQPVRKKESFKEVWEEWKDVAEENDISKELFYDRTKRYKWSKEKAATTKKGASRARSTHKWTQEEEELMKKNGLSKNLVATRITSLKWSREEALNTPIISEAERLDRVRAGVKNREINMNEEWRKYGKRF